MIHFLQTAGPAIFPLMILAAVIAILTIKKAVDLFARKDLGPPELERGINAIIFWGAISAVLGVHAQLTGIYNALRAIARATEISPNVIMIGLAESFTTTLFGLTLFIISAVCWFALHSRYKSLALRSK